MSDTFSASFLKDLVKLSWGKIMGIPPHDKFAKLLNSIFLMQQNYTENKNQELIDKKELARLLKVSKHTITKWVQDRYIPYRKIGRFIRFDYNEILSHFNEIGNYPAQK